MDFSNQTRFAAEAFRQFDRSGGFDCVVAVRGTFDVRHGAVLAVAHEQEPFQWTDVYEGDPHTTMLIRQGDLVPNKPGTDVTFLGDTVRPAGSADGPWFCGLRVGDGVNRRLRVMGARSWQARTRRTWRGLFQRDPKPLLEGWTLGEPAPASRVPLRWDAAYGGAIPGGTADVHPDNPLGRGMVDLTLGVEALTRPAPSIEAADAPVAGWAEVPPPAGFAPVAPWWRLRQRHVGTYDETWLATRHPLLPEDFDDRFWQCAPEGLIATPHLAGAEPFVLENLHPSHPRLTGTLPGIMLGVRVKRAETENRHALALDGVHFDFRDGRDLAMLTWRARFPMPDMRGVSLMLAERARVRLGPRQAAADA